MIERLIRRALIGIELSSKGLSRVRLFNYTRKSARSPAASRTGTLRKSAPTAHVGPRGEPAPRVEKRLCPVPPSARRGRDGSTRRDAPCCPSEDTWRLSFFFTRSWHLSNFTRLLFNWKPIARKLRARPAAVQGLGMPRVRPCPRHPNSLRVAVAFTGSWLSGRRLCPQTETQGRQRDIAFP